MDKCALVLPQMCGPVAPIFKSARRRARLRRTAILKSKENTQELLACFWNAADCWDVPSTRHADDYAQDAELESVLEYCTAADVRAGEGRETKFPES